jgi:hypothetical protein
LRVSVSAYEVIDEPQIQQLAGKRTFGGVLNTIPGRQEWTGAARGMPGDNHEVAGMSREGFAKDQLD